MYNVTRFLVQLLYITNMSNFNIQTHLEQQEITLLACRNKVPIYSWKDKTKEELTGLYNIHKVKPDVNTAIACGYEHGAFCIDIDGMDGYYNWIKFCKDHDENDLLLGPSFVEKTPNGWHLWFKCPEELKELTINDNFPCKNVDYRCQHGYGLSCYGSTYNIEMCRKNKGLHKCGSTSDDTCTYNGIAYKALNCNDFKELPMWLVEIYTREIKPKKEIMQDIINIYSNNTIDEIESETSCTSLTKEVIIEVLNLCDLEKRWGNYNGWFTLGCAMFNSGMTLRLFHDYSIKTKGHSGSFEDGTCCCINKWHEFKSDINRGITMGTIRMWAKEDNPDGYNELFNIKIDKICLINSNEYNSIRIIHNKFKDTKFKSLTELYKKVGKELNTAITIVDSVSSIIYIYEKSGNYIMKLIKIDSFWRQHRGFSLNYLDQDGKENKISFEKIVSHEVKIYINFVNLPYNKDIGNIYHDEEKRIINIGNPLRFTKIEYTNEKIKLIIDYLTLLVNNDEILFNHLILWLAHIVKYPASKTGQAIFLYSNTHGTGKTTFIRLLRALLGSIHCRTMNNIENLFNKFNQYLSDTTIINVEEPRSTWNERKKDFGILKDLITGDTIDVENKGENGKEDMKSFSNYIFTSNNIDCIPIEHGDRRYFIIKVPNTMRYSPNYLKTINDIIQYNHHVMQCFYSYLMDLDVRCNNLPDIPMTEIKNLLITINSTSVEMFFRDELKKCDKLNYNRNDYTISELYGMYKEWHNPNHGTFIIENTFIKQCEPFIEFTKRTKKDRLYKLLMY